MSKLKDLLIDADMAAEEILDDGCEDFKQFCDGMRKLREISDNWLLENTPYLEQVWQEHTQAQYYKHRD
jgi:hypothetical protein